MRVFHAIPFPPWGYWLRPDATAADCDRKYAILQESGGVTKHTGHPRRGGQLPTVSITEEVSNKE
jgi:hypothetical protein